VKDSSSLPPTFRFGVFELSPSSGELRKRGVRVRLQGQPVEILALLLQRPGETITREELQKKLWPADTFVDFEQGLNNAMKRLRAALDDNPDNPRFIETLPRHGYRFLGSVNSAGSSTAETAPARSLRPAIRLSQVSMLVLLAISAGLVGLYAFGLRDRFFARASKPQIQVLAVLPLTNLSGNPDQEYFADGMTEELITELGKIGTLRVISRQSVMQYKGSKKPLQEIARELNVDAVLEGAVERSGDRVRVSIRLDQVSPESQLWANQYNRDIRDVLRLQDDIARTVTDEIQVKLTSKQRARLASARSVDPAAHDAYLHGQFFLYQDKEQLETRHGIEQSLQTAIGYFRQTLEREPDYAPAYGGLADAYIALGSPSRGGGYPKATLPLAKEAAAKALELDPSLAGGHFSLAQINEFYDWNWSEAEKQYRAALQLNPNDAFAHIEYARFVQAMGRNDEAMTHVNYALALDPFDFKIKYYWTWVMWASRQYDLAIEKFQVLGADLGLGWAYQKKEMYPEAIVALQRSVNKSHRHSLDLASLAYVYGLAGKKSEALKLITELHDRDRHHYISRMLFVHAYLGLGDKDQALTWLEQAYEDRDQWMVYINSTPMLDALRPEPRFQSLVRRMNFPP
jgi:TolB-like protein/DNA-binding winged helix-turn-helix (wHTH) protein